MTNGPDADYYASLTPMMAKQQRASKLAGEMAVAKRRREKMKTAIRRAPLHTHPHIPTPPCANNRVELDALDAAEETWWKAYAAALEMPPPAHVAERLPHSERAGSVKQFMRDTVMLSDRICCYCLEAPSTTLDHIFPRARGGQNLYKNLVGACVPCNSTKSDFTPQEAGMTLHRPERFKNANAVPSWYGHLPLVTLKAETEEVSPLVRMSGYRVRRLEGRIVFEAITVDSPWRDDLANILVADFAESLHEADIMVAARLTGDQLQVIDAPPGSAQFHREALTGVRSVFPELPVSEHGLWAATPWQSQCP